MNDGQIIFEVTADGKHAIGDIKALTAEIQKETKKWDDAAQRSTDNMSNGFSSMLKKLVAGFSAVKIGKALLDFGKDALQAASDLAEVQNVVDVTFGDNASTIERWAKTASTQFGLTETQAKRFSSTMGAMLKSAGLAGDQIVDVSTDLAGLAADMASFYNLDFDTAFQKIRSGISGETEPLKQLGINMSVANLNAYALQQGLSKTFEQMSQGEQTMLRYQYIMSATADAQGDFARTSDEFANSRRKLQSNIEQIKTLVGTTYKGAITDATNILNGFLESLLPDESKRTVLDDITDIDKDVEGKIAQIQSIAEEARLTMGVLDELFGKDQTGKDAANVIAQYGVKSDQAQGFLESLGLTTEEINEKQETWLETCRRLVKTIPGLNSIINTETGEVKGGTQAVQDYIKAWEDGQTKLAMLGAIEKRQNAIDERFSDLPGLQLDMALAQRKVRQQADAIRELYKKNGIREDLLPVGTKLRTTEGVYANLPIEQMREINGAVMILEDLQEKEKEATEAFNNQKAALEEAVEAQKEYIETVNEMPDGIQTAIDAVEEWTAEEKAAATERIDALKQSLDAMTDYAEGIRNSVAKAVDGTVSGFKKIETPMMQNREKVKDLTKQIDGLDSKSKTYKEDLKKLNDELSKANGERVSAQSMGASLKQQAQFMEDYLTNLKKARALGVSNEVLASLSDGSEESFDYLEQLAKASPAEVETINKNFQKVIDKKKELTDELTGQQLSVDETYKSLAEKAKAAVQELDQYQTAADGTGKTMQGIIDGINSHVPGVQEAVDAILAQLNRLSSWGISIDAGGFGQIDLATPSGEKTRTRKGVVESVAMFGLDYVPRDNWYARLHEGERVLTAQENQIWNALRNGGVAGFDLETLGGVMRDNIKPGGNVYMDSRIVGRVISDRQGQSYKSLTRSGWQQ